MTIRSLLEHVEAIEPGQRIYVDGVEVDPPWPEALGALLGAAAVGGALWLSLRSWRRRP